MKISDWKFVDNPNVMVITTKNIIENEKPILSVWHDEDDGMWQFLDGEDINEENAVLVSLEHIVNLDNSINDISDLKVGWVAWREKKEFEWRIQKIDD